jgi:hypothetical protein
MRRISSVVTATALLALVGGCEVHDPQLCFDKNRYREMEAEWDARDSAEAVARELLRHELPRREAQWTAHRLTAYRLAVDLTCYCQPEPAVAVVTVWDDSSTVTDALGLPLGADLSKWLGSAVGDVAFTVPKLFAEVRQALADPTWTVEVKFDSAYGFPREVLKRKQLTDSMSETQMRALSPFGYRAVVERFQPQDSATR